MGRPSNSLSRFGLLTSVCRLSISSLTRIYSQPTQYWIVCGLACRIRKCYFVSEVTLSRPSPLTFPFMASSHSSGKKKTTVAGVAIAILIALYSLVRPSINDATGWSLPAIAQSQATPETAPATPPLEQPRKERTTDTAESSRERQNTQPPSTAGDSTSDRGPRSDLRPVEKTQDSAPTADASLKYGLLREVGRDRYISPAGLLYTPGSAEGHRLEHLRRHTQDQPGRPGKHGVFEGGMEGALKIIDQAYENAKIGKRTTKRSDDGRTIYTVDMGHRVGYVGGREGNQRHKPMARRVQLVLEGNRVITAFPL